MSRNARIALIAVLVAVAAGAFVVLKPGDDQESPATPSGGAAATTNAATTTTSTAAPRPKPKATVIRIKAGRPVGGVQELTVKQGDRIRFTVTADAAQHVHLHGYDIEKSVGPGAPAVYSVPATINGVFEVEIEDTSTQIAKLTVNP